MKKLTLFTLTILSVLAFTSCSKEDDFAMLQGSYSTGLYQGIIWEAEISFSGKTFETKIWESTDGMVFKVTRSEKGTYEYVHPDIYLTYSDGHISTVKISDDLLKITGGSTYYKKN